VIVADLPRRELVRRLAGPGIRLRTGPFVSRVQSRLPAIVRGIALHYAEYQAEDDEGFADFHVRVSRPHSVRRWLRPQAQFFVDGNVPFAPLPLDQAFPMLEWGLNWCVSTHCHQYLIFHAAVVEKSGRALILPAPPGSGKSTLCAGLVNRGWRLLSDELTLIDIAACAVVPLPRPVSLKNASIDVIRAFAPNVAIGPTVHDTTKGSVAHMRAPGDSVRRGTQSARPGWIVLPRYQSGAPARLTPLSRARGLMQMADNAFNYSAQGRRGFEFLARFIDQCDCHEFTYGDLDEAAMAFDDLATRR
jgi:HprK-related kinase A